MGQYSDFELLNAFMIGLEDKFDLINFWLVSELCFEHISRVNLDELEVILKKVVAFNTYHTYISIFVRLVELLKSQVIDIKWEWVNL